MKDFEFTAAFYGFDLSRFKSSQEVMAFLNKSGLPYFEDMDDVEEWRSEHKELLPSDFY